MNSLKLNLWKIDELRIEKLVDQFFKAFEEKDIIGLIQYVKENILKHFAETEIGGNAKPKLPITTACVQVGLKGVNGDIKIKRLVVGGTMVFQNIQPEQSHLTLAPILMMIIGAQS